MDKFEEFLSEKAKKENEEFILPESFEKNLDNVLDSIEDKKTKFKLNKKFLVMAASLLVVLFVGLELRCRLNNANLVETINIEGSSKSRNLPEAIIAKDSTEEILEENVLNTGSINSIQVSDYDNFKYKVLNKKEDIEILINYINNLEIAKSSKSMETKNDFKIEIDSENFKVLRINENLLEINNQQVYEILNYNKEKFIEIYDRFDCDEKNIN